MISRNLLQKSLVNKQIAKFGGGDIRHKFNDEITDEELRRYDYAISHTPEKAEKPFTLYNFFASFPLFKTNSWLNFFSEDLVSSRVRQTNDFYRPPKVHENSVFIYQSHGLATTARKARSIETLAIGLGAVALQYPFFIIPFAIPAYILWGNAFFYEMSRRLVTRMDLLPHLEMVSVQRVGLGGLVYNKLYRVQDLEYVSYDSAFDKENYFWSLCQHTVDKHLIFRCKATGEYLLFDQQGKWDHEGLNHPLLN